MTQQDQINEMKRTVTWVKKVIALLEQGRVDLAKDELEGRITEINARRLNLDIHLRMAKRDRKYGN